MDSNQKGNDPSDRPNPLEPGGGSQGSLGWVVLLWIIAGIFLAWAVLSNLSGPLNGGWGYLVVYSLLGGCVVGQIHRSRSGDVGEAIAKGFVSAIAIGVAIPFAGFGIIFAACACSGGGF